MISSAHTRGRTQVYPSRENQKRKGTDLFRADKICRRSVKLRPTLVHRKVRSFKGSISEHPQVFAAKTLCQTINRFAANSEEVDGDEGTGF